MWCLQPHAPPRGGGGAEPYSHEDSPYLHAPCSSLEHLGKQEKEEMWVLGFIPEKPRSCEDSSHKREVGVLRRVT